MFPRCLFLFAMLAFTTTRAVALSLLHWNVAGNGTTDWSTNAVQVDAIGRQILYWRPEVVTFNEIPRTNLWQMANFVSAYLPGYFLATNSGTDGFLRSVIASRYPIARSQKWLENASLAPFGYTNTTSTFARDLFEAEIIVPGWTEHLHVFTTHLKATDNGSAYTNSVLRRAAEAAAVSNHLVTAFLPTNGHRPYVLTGDLNEDINKPPTSGGQSISGHPIERLTSAPTGLRFTTPTNPVTGIERTFGIGTNSNPSSRLDYIMPCGLLFSNIAGSQVFRTDKLFPMPPNLFTNDSATASDHLPVLMSFHNPYDPAPRITSLTPSNQFLNVSWLAVTGRSYRVETTTNLLTWSAATTNLFAATTNLFATIPRATSRQFLRVQRLP
jgi:endonuclease/exonuclease/phosphatase family metal-dependent hydrolase